MDAARRARREGPPRRPAAAPTRRAFLGRLALLAVPALSRCGRDGDRAGQGPLAGDRREKEQAGLPLPDREPWMRVRVLRARGAHADARIGGDRQWLRVGPAGREGAEIVLRGPLTVCRPGSRWSIVDLNGAIAPMEGLEGVAIGALAAEEPVVAVGELAYPGSIELSARTDEDDGAFDVINVVRMEDYLPGVVAGELFDHWRFHTRAAQAVAARSFAASERAQIAGRRAYDVTNTPDSQVYRGVVGHRETHEAVEETRGIVLTYDGRLVSGYYSSCCGGLAASAVDAIGHNPINAIAPLRGRKGMDVCTETEMARWTIQRPVRTLTRRLAAWGERRRLAALAGFARLAGVEIVGRNAHGRPTRYAAIDRGGQRVELSAHQLRSAANYHGPGFARPKRPLWSSCVQVAVKGSTATFDGRGFGHGVGMCQYGAEMLAKHGSRYEDILAWYYPDVELVEAYGMGSELE